MKVPKGTVLFLWFKFSVGFLQVLYMPNAKWAQKWYVFHYITLVVVCFKRSSLGIKVYPEIILNNFF